MEPMFHVRLDEGRSRGIDDIGAQVITIILPNKHLVQF